MNEYKVVIKVRRNDGLLPDFFGKEETAYIKADSAGEVKKGVDTLMKDNFGFELYSNEISYDIKEITKI